MNTLIFVLPFCSTSDVAGCECVTVTLGRPGENAQIEKKIKENCDAYFFLCDSTTTP